MAAEDIKTMRDSVKHIMDLAKRLNDQETFKSAKEKYSQLCADYFDAVHGNCSGD